MNVMKKDISLEEAIEFSNHENLLLKRRENNILLSDYQIDVLKRNGINYNMFNNVRELLFEIENCLDDFFDSELDLISSQLSEYIYYSDTKK